MSDEKGWIKVHRKIQNDQLYPRGRRFTNFEAWMDLLLSANWRDSQILRGYQLIDVKRGQVFTSAVALAKRWRWNRKSVVLFLELLKTDTKADIKTSKGRDTGYTLITILNYEKYQDGDDSALDIKDRTARDIKLDTKRDIIGTLNGTYPRSIKNIKNNGASKIRSRPHPEDADLRIQILLTSFIRKYLERVGTPYVVVDGKDPALLKRLLAAGHDVAAIESVMDRYFADPFYSSTTGFDVGGFSKAYSRLKSVGSKPKHDYEKDAYPTL
jgi:hypothetical protein